MRDANHSDDRITIAMYGDMAQIDFQPELDRVRHGGSRHARRGIELAVPIGVVGMLALAARATRARTTRARH
jgi:hypothetical protein